MPKAKASGIKYVVYPNGIVYHKESKQYRSTIQHHRIIDYLMTPYVSRKNVDAAVEASEEEVIAMLDAQSVPLLVEVEPVRTLKCPNCSTLIIY